MMSQFGLSFKEHKQNSFKLATTNYSLLQTGTNINTNHYKEAIYFWWSIKSTMTENYTEILIAVCNCYLECLLLWLIYTECWIENIMCSGNHFVQTMSLLNLTQWRYDWLVMLSILCILSLTKSCPVFEVYKFSLILLQREVDVKNTLANCNFQVFLNKTMQDKRYILWGESNREISEALVSLVM